MTTSRVAPVVPSATVHEHGWVTESVHATSEGRVRYVRCTGCVARRIDLDAAAAAPASALSHEIVALGDGDHGSSPGS